MNLAAQNAITTEPSAHRVRAIPDGQIGVDVMLRRVALEVRYTDQYGVERSVCRGMTAGAARLLANQLLAAANVAGAR